MRGVTLCRASPGTQPASSKPAHWVAQVLVAPLVAAPAEAAGGVAAAGSSRRRLTCPVES